MNRNLTRRIIISGLLVLAALAAGCSGSGTDAPSVSPETSADQERLALAETYQNRAEAHLDIGELSGAAIALEQAEMLVPGHPRTLYLLGRVSLEQGDALAAIPDLRLAWESDPDHEEYRDVLREALILAGEGFYQDEEFDRSWEVLSEASQLESTPDLQYLKGLVAYAWARTTETDDHWDHLSRAETAFRAVLEERPGDTDARFNLGAVLLALEEYDEAIVLYRDLLTENPTDGGLYLALSRAHSMGGDTDAGLAEEAIGSALRAGDPVDNPATWSSRASERFPASDLAMVYLEQGVPEAVYTYALPGGSLVEVWFYWEAEIVEAFREGGRIGRTISIDQ